MKLFVTANKTKNGYTSALVITLGLTETLSSVFKEMERRCTQARIQRGIKGLTFEVNKLSSRRKK